MRRARKPSYNQKARANFPQEGNYPLITSSDAHYLKDVGSALILAKVAAPGFTELKKALDGREASSFIEAI